MPFPVEVGDAKDVRAPAPVDVHALRASWRRQRRDHGVRRGLVKVVVSTGTGFPAGIGHQSADGCLLVDRILRVPRLIRLKQGQQDTGWGTTILRSVFVAIADEGAGPLRQRVGREVQSSGGVDACEQRSLAGIDEVIADDRLPPGTVLEWG